MDKKIALLLVWKDTLKKIVWEYLHAFDSLIHKKSLLTSGGLKIL